MTNNNCEGTILFSVDMIGLDRSDFGCQPGGTPLECEERKEAFASSATVNANFDLQRQGLPQTVVCVIVSFSQGDSSSSQIGQIEWTRLYFVASVHTSRSTLLQSASAMETLVNTRQYSILSPGSAEYIVATNFIIGAELISSSTNTTETPDIVVTSNVDSTALTRSEIGYIVGVGAGALLCCTILVLLFVERRRRNDSKGILVHEPRQSSYYSRRASDYNTGYEQTHPYMDTTPYLDVRARKLHYYPSSTIVDPFFGRANTSPGIEIDNLPLPHSGSHFYPGESLPHVSEMDLSTYPSPANVHFYPPGGETDGPDGWRRANQYPESKPKHYFPGRRAGDEMSHWEMDNSEHIHSMSPADFSELEQLSQSSWFNHRPTQAHYTRNQGREPPAARLPRSTSRLSPARAQQEPDDYLWTGY